MKTGFNPLLMPHQLLKHARGCQVTAMTYTVKVRDDLIENPETLDASIIDAFLSVEIRKVWDGGKHHTNFII